MVGQYSVLHRRTIVQVFEVQVLQVRERPEQKYSERTLTTDGHVLIKGADQPISNRIDRLLIISCLRCQRQDRPQLLL